MGRPPRDPDEQRLLELGAGDAPITAEDLPSFNAALQRILQLMQGGKWHSASEIIEVSEQREGLRRLRELRRLGWKVAKIRGKGREWWYRLYRPGTSKYPHVSHRPGKYKDCLLCMQMLMANQR